MRLLDPATWPAALIRLTDHMQGCTITLRHQSERGEPGLVALWRLPLERLYLDGQGRLIVVAGAEVPITYSGLHPARLWVQPTDDRQTISRFRAEFTDGSAITIEFHD